MPRPSTNHSHDVELLRLTNSSCIHGARTRATKVAEKCGNFPRGAAGGCRSLECLHDALNRARESAYSCSSSDNVPSATSISARCKSWRRAGRLGSKTAALLGRQHAAARREPPRLLRNALALPILPVPRQCMRPSMQDLQSQDFSVVAQTAEHSNGTLARCADHSLLFRARPAAQRHPAPTDAGITQGASRAPPAPALDEMRATTGCHRESSALRRPSAARSARRLP